MESLKKLSILAIFAIIIVVLLYAATPKTTTVTTTPSQQAYLEPVIIVEPETPIYNPPQIPGQDIQDITPPPLALIPAHTYLWVNNILVPTIISEYSFIPLKENKIKTFSGSFGPYPDDFRKYLTVTLCSEDARVPSAPSCELVELVYRDGYIDFGTGYKEDEYIGYTARKDYYAYYQVHSGEYLLAQSPKAYVRTVEE